MELPLGDDYAKRPRRRRALIPAGDRDDLVTQVLKQVSMGMDERDDWVQRRLARYAKLRGWIESRNWPWANASNQHVPIMLANKLRVDAGLYNAVLGIRPLMKSMPTQLKHKDAAENIDHLLDHQMFVDNDGERRLEKFIDQFTGDGTVFSHQPWVKERGTLHDVRTIPTPMTTDGKCVDTDTLDALVQDQIGKFDTLVTKDEHGYSWVGHYVDDSGVPRECDIEVYDHSEDDDDTKIDVCFAWDATLYEGPTMLVMDLEDVVAPMRSENAQPVSMQNPTGAPWLTTIHRVPTNQIERLRQLGVYDLLTQADMDEYVLPMAQQRTEGDTAHAEEQLKTQRDEQTGLESQPSDEDRDWVTVYQHYCAKDVNDDGLDEEIILTILKEPKLLARVRYLSEMYPGLPPKRPIAEARFIPVSGQFYGMGIVELMEGLHDFLHVLVNQNIDYGTLSNLPFFAYRASSGFKPQEHRLEPGMGLALDNPQTDLVFPQMPNRDQTWNFNMIGLGMQFLEKLVQISPLQFGQVPQGKASALRTVGTTMAILQQGAAMPEQILRRLFTGIKDVYSQFHLLNTRFLPPKKRYLVTGRPLDSQEAYGLVDDRKDISIPIAFSFQSTLLNTNKGVVGQALLGIGQAIFSPIAWQLGLVTPEQFYNWAKDVIQANQLDPARYIVKPAGAPDLPRVDVHEAILLITQGILPTDRAPLEPVEQHLQGLMKFMQSDEFGYLQGGKELLFQQYLMYIQGLLRQQMQQQMLAQSAAQFTQMLGQGQDGGSKGGDVGQVPDMQTEMGTQDELAGATGESGG